MSTDQTTPTQELRPLRIFLCHSSGDKPKVRELYHYLKQHHFLPWLDEEDLIAGRDWEEEISRAVRDSDVVLVCLSREAVTRDGFRHKEIKFALDRADEKAPGSIFVIPVRLEEVEVPQRLSRWHWVNLFQADGHDKLLRALNVRANDPNIARNRAKGNGEGQSPSPDDQPNMASPSAPRQAHGRAEARLEQSRDTETKAPGSSRRRRWVKPMIAVTGVLCLVVAGWRISLWLHPPVHSDPSDDRATVKAKDGQSYVWIRPGLFLMGCSTADGSCYKDEKPSHVVTITKGFWLGQTEVKQEAFQRVMATNPSHFRGDRLPVESVSWEQAKSYCEATGMRLPTEAEWEYAARAGSSVTRYGDLDNIAYYNTNSGNHTNEVGQKQPNAWKLYDMIGNVWEWTNDWFDPDYYSSGPPPQDPKGPSHGEYHVIRGGSWISYPWILRVSFRYRGGPDVKPELIGFRCAGDTL